MSNWQTLFLICAFADLAGAQTQDDDWIIRAETVYTAAGAPIAGGHVGVVDGKIVSVGSGRGSGGEVLEVAAVTPGLIDLSVRIGTRDYSVEQSTETPIELSVADALDLYSYRWQRELESGVTAVLATPFDNAVLGGFGVVLKTGGPTSLEGRLVKDQAVLRGSMGGQPSQGNFPPRGLPPVTFYARRPTTRMGVEWVFRKTYYDALAVAKSGAEVDERAAERNAILQRTLRGDLPVAVQAWATQDVRTAVYLKEEFGIPNMFVDAAAEAWREPDLLVRSGMGVVLPPHAFAGRTGDDGAFFAWNTAALLHEAGVPIALSGHGSADIGDRLARQPAWAMRGGLPFEAALAAVTIQPARMVGVDDRIGSIETGKDADLVLWSGEPFALTSKIVGVLLNGLLIVDPRPSDQ